MVGNCSSVLTEKLYLPESGFAMSNVRNHGVCEVNVDLLGFEFKPQMGLSISNTQYTAVRPAVLTSHSFLHLFVIRL